MLSLTYHLHTAGGPAPAPPSTDPLAWRGDFLNFRYDGRVNYLGDLPADPAVCAAYRAQGYTDCLIASNLGPQPGADDPFDLFGDPDAYAARCRGFSSRGIRAIGQVGFEDNWAVWERYADDFPAHLTRLVAAAAPVVSSWCFGLEWDEGIVQGRYSWDDTLDWMVLVWEVTHQPLTIHMRQTAWGPEGDAPWHGGQQLSWWKALRHRLPDAPLAMAFQHRHDRPQDQRANGGFLTAADDIVDHVLALTSPTRLGGIGVGMISAEYAWNGVDPAAWIVTEEEGRQSGHLALTLGAIGALNGV